MTRRTRAWWVALLVPALTAACSSSGHGASSGAEPTTTTRPAAPEPTPAIPWAALHNPVLTSSQYAVKDPALVFAGGAWHALFSAVDRRGTWRIGLATSTDLQHWSPISIMPHDAAVEGEASPDVVRAPDGKWVVTYQSFVHDRAGAAPKLYYRTTDDFTHYSDARPLGRELHPAATDRMIDAAVAWTPAGLLLGYKYGADEQHFELARSESGNLDGPWKLVGRPDITVYGDTIENYQFVPLGGRWRLLATSNLLDRPFLFTLAGDAHTADGWLHWTPGRELHVPQEAWNPGTGPTGVAYEHANCAFVVNRGPVDGATYLVYADSPNKTTFGGEGPAVLALARSTDLVTWSVPGS
jgi:hypothetical protein